MSKYRSIPLRMVIYIAWQNLTHKKLRSLLTISGVVIGVGAIYFLLSFGIGLQHLVTEQVIGNQSIKSIDVASPNSKIIMLNDANYEKMQHLGHVEKYGAVLSMPGSLTLGNSAANSVVVYGVDKGYIPLANLVVLAGNVFTPGDLESVVINKSALDAAGITNAKTIVGQKVKLTIPLQGAKKNFIEGSYKVSAVVDSGSGAEIYMDYAIFSSQEIDRYTQAKIVADVRENVPKLRQQIESMGFQTVSPVDTIDQIDKIFRLFNMALGAFGAIGMIVAILGMFNTLTISLIERTREIGLMIALGGRNKDMSRLFIFEALLLSVVGAVAGIILATAMGFVGNILLNAYAHGRGVRDSFDLFATPWWLNLTMIGAMIVVGLMVVFFPAKRAQHTNPIDALRRE